MVCAFLQISTAAPPPGWSEKTTGATTPASGYLLGFALLDPRVFHVCAFVSNYLVVIALTSHAFALTDDVVC